MAIAALSMMAQRTRKYIDCILLGEERCGSEGGRRAKERVEGGRGGRVGVRTGVGEDGGGALRAAPIPAKNAGDEQARLETTGARGRTGGGRSTT